MERGKRGYAFVVLALVVVGFPDADFVVLVCGEEDIVVNDEGLDGCGGGCHNNVVVGV